MSTILRTFNFIGMIIMLFQGDAERRGYGGLRSASKFGQQADVIVTEWLSRRAAQPSRRIEGPNAWLKQEAYVLIGWYIENDAAKSFARLAMADRRQNRLIDDAAKNPFKLGLLAMFADDNLLSRANRHVFGNQMLFAWAHDVPSEFLNAFLAISGGPSAISEKIKGKISEPGFEHRFIADRLFSGT